MRSLPSMIWKETRETLIYLWIGLFVFLGLPLIGAYENHLFAHSRKFVLDSIGWVTALGGVLAVFAAIGATCRDLSPRLLDFWRSRPTAPWVWMLIKFAVGWCVVQLACLVPMGVDYALDRDRVKLFLLLWLPSLFSAVYAVAFLAGCLVRRTAHAAMLGLSALLLISLLPSVVASLSWASMNQPLGWPVARFALVMLGVTIVALSTALLITQTDFQIESTRKLMYGAIAGSMLLLFASATWQLGTNLPVLQQLSLDPREYAYRIDLKDDHGTLYTQLWDTDGRYQSKSYARSIQLTAGALQIGPRSLQDFSGDWESRFGVHGHPGWTYDLEPEAIDHPEAGPIDDYSAPHVIALYVENYHTKENHRIAGLWTEGQRDAAPTWADRTDPYIYNDHFYAIGGRRVAVFDLSDPMQPKLTYDEPHHYDFGWFNYSADRRREIVTLPILPGVPAQERLRYLASRGNGLSNVYENDLICVNVRNPDGALAAYHVVKLTDDAVTLDLIAFRPRSPLSNLFGGAYNHRFQLQNGLLYVEDWRGASQVLNPALSVYDPRQNLKLVGHFAAQGAGEVLPLPDGRAIVAGSKVFLLGPPPKR